MKKLVSLLLCIALLSCCVLSAGAVPTPLQFGDVDLDYQVTVLDATKIQRFLAYFEEPSALVEALSDADNDGMMTVLDVTAIQRYLAGLDSAYVYRSAMEYYVGDTASHSTGEVQNMTRSSNQEDICYVGVPATFTASVKWGNQPQIFRFSVDDEVLEEINANNSRTASFTHTFMQEGSYTVNTLAECRYGVKSNFKRNVRVIPLPEDKPVVMGAAFFGSSYMSSGNGVLTVTAAGGTAPYQYSFEVRFEEDESYDFDAPAMMIRGYNTGFIDKNEIDIFRYGMSESRMYDTIIRVKVKDADGNVSDPILAHFCGYELNL